MMVNKVEKDEVNRISVHNYLSNYKRFRNEHKNNYVLFFEAMFFGILAALIIDKLFWLKYTGITHSILELVCIVSNMSLFFIVWSKYKDSPTSSKIIAFGLLATSIFDVIHIYYFGPLGLITKERIDLGPRFWVLGRLTEVITIFVASLAFQGKGMKLSKPIALLAPVLLPVTIAYLNISNNNIVPILYDDNGVTMSKIIVELVIMVLATASLLRHKKKIKENGYISYKYLSLALATIIPTEICFMIYKTYVSSIVVYGHVFRVIYCYFLYKSIFQSSIEHTHSELEHLKRRLNNILDSIPIGIETYDSNWNLDFANKELENLFGCKKEEIIGLKNTEMYNTFKSDDGKGSILEEMKNGRKGPDSLITTIKRKDGQKVKVHFQVKNLDGEGALLIAKDAAKEQEIDNLHIQTYTILNSMQSPAFICDNQYKIFSANKSFEELIGLHYESLIKMEMRDLLQLINYENKTPMTMNTNNDDVAEQFELKFTSTYGEKKEVLANLSNIRNVNGDIIGKVCVITDITELKKQQEKTLHNEKLVLLGQMGATIVHETRNFLTTIKGCSQLIEVISNEDRIVNYAKKINKSTDQVNLIISDFLSLSKPKKAITEEVAVCDLLSSIRNTLETSSLMKGLNMEFLSNLDERYILCDETQINQVVLNICKNAVEAMECVKNPKLRIESMIKEDDNGLYIKISDNGKGMNKETLDKIGTAFFTTKQSGTGLGLSVCFDIVKQHGGSIEVDSEEGVGTTFTINIPGIEDDELEEVI